MAEVSMERCRRCGQWTRAAEFQEFELHIPLESGDWQILTQRMCPSCGTKFLRVWDKTPFAPAGVGVTEAVAPQWDDLRGDAK